MQNPSDTVEAPEILNHLHALKHTPARKSGNVINGRAKFIEEAKGLSESNSQPVSGFPFASLMVRIKKLLHIRETREGMNMHWMKYSTVILIITMLFGGAVTAVKASEGSLPGELIYPVKIMAEDAQGILAGPIAKVEQSMFRVENRIQEILRLREQNKAVPESAYLRLENQLELTFRLMMGLSEDELIPGLIRFQSRLMAQGKLLQELQGQRQMNNDAVLERLRTLLQTRLQFVGECIQDPQQLELQVRTRDRVRETWSESGTQAGNDQQPSTWVGAGPLASTHTPAAYEPGQGPVEGTATGNSHGPGSIAGTPTPGAYGPGPGPAENTPAATPYGPGPVDDTSTPGAYGPGPSPIENTPTPVSYGPGGTPTPKATAGGGQP